MTGYGLDSPGLGQESVVSSCDKLSYSTQLAELLSCSQAGLCDRKPATFFSMSLQKRVTLSPCLYPYDVSNGES
jgi:hypothetical protein